MDKDEINSGPGGRLKNSVDGLSSELKEPNHGPSVCTENMFSDVVESIPKTSFQYLMDDTTVRDSQEQIQLDQELAVDVAKDGVIPDSDTEFTSSSSLKIKDEISSHLIYTDANLKCSSPTDFFAVHGNFNANSALRQELGLATFDLDKATTDQQVLGETLEKSPLLHESSKDVALCSASQVQDHVFLDDHLPGKDAFITSEISEELFSTPLNDGVTGSHLDTTEESCKERISDVLEKQEDGLATNIDVRLLEIKKEPTEVKDSEMMYLESQSSSPTENKPPILPSSLQGFDHKVVMINKLPLAQSTLNDNSASGDANTQVVNLPIVDGRFPSEIGIPLTAIDVKILPLLLLGNFAVLPAHTSSIKLQVVQDDGTIKRVSVTPICKGDASEPPVAQSDVAKSSSSSHDSVVVTEVVSNNNTDPSRPFKCELCSATFNRLGNYTRHKKIHTAATKEDHRFHCEICSKSFIQRCDLTRHMHIHSGTEPHRCSLCGKGYIRHSDLVTHQRFHNKEKPFSCPQCSKGFSQRGDLNRHLRSIHLQVKPLACGHCHKKFAKEATLLRHMQISHRDIILKSLNQQGSL